MSTYEARDFAVSVQMVKAFFMQILCFSKKEIGKIFHLFYIVLKYVLKCQKSIKLTEKYDLARQMARRGEAGGVGGGAPRCAAGEKFFFDINF